MLGVCLGCLTGAERYYHTSISVGVRRICNLRFADDIDLLGGSNAELQELTDKLTQSAGSFGLEWEVCRYGTVSAVTFST